MPILKAYQCTVNDYDGFDIQLAATASKARYKYWLLVSDTNDRLKIIDVKVRRAPEHDVTFPSVTTVPEDLDEEDREIILHSFGGGAHIDPDKWGYRDHYCCPPDDAKLNRLVTLEMMTGPHGVDGSGNTPGCSGAYYYLTPSGKEAARALIGARECR